MSPTLDDGGVQSNSNVWEPVLLRLLPAGECSINWSGLLAGHVCVSPKSRKAVLRSRAFAPHARLVFGSVTANWPADVFVLDARRAVSWNPHRRALDSVMVTTQCCLTPGT